MQWHEAFDQIRIINLETRRDRRRETEQEFARHGLSLTPPRARFFAAIAPAEAAGFPNPGVRGCYLSHLAVLREACETAHGPLLVLEDDVAFTRRIGQAAPEAIAALGPLDWDLAYLGHAYPDEPGPVGWLRIDTPRPLAHCYAVHPRVLPRLVRFLEDILQRPPGHPDGGPMHIDGALSTFITRHRDEVRAYRCSVNLAYQRPSRTDLHRPSLLDRHAILGPLARGYRGLKRLYWHLSR